MDNEYKYMVATLCKTFNHGPYIEEALNGFAIQQTTFPCVFIVIDDASADGEPDLLRQWAEENLLLGHESEGVHEHLPYGERYVGGLKKNQQSVFVIILLSENHYKKKSKKPYFAEWFDNSKYVAICEGDDYWIQPRKLQKQVDIMDNDSTVGMCYTAYRWCYQESGATRDVYTSPKIKHDKDILWKTLDYEVTIGTATVLMRSDLYKRIRETCAEDFKGYMMGDTQTWFHFARISKIYYLPEITAVYRKHEGSVTALGDAEKKLVFVRSMLSMRIDLAKKYGAPKEVIERMKRQISAMQITNCLSLKSYEEALNINKEYLSNNPIFSIMIKIAKVLHLRRMPGIGYLINRLPNK